MSTWGQLTKQKKKKKTVIENGVVVTKVVNVKKQSAKDAERKEKKFTNCYECRDCGVPLTELQAKFVIRHYDPKLFFDKANVACNRCLRLTRCNNPNCETFNNYTISDCKIVDNNAHEFFMAGSSGIYIICKNKNCGKPIFINSLPDYPDLETIERVAAKRKEATNGTKNQS